MNREALNLKELEFSKDLGISPQPICTHIGGVKGLLNREFRALGLGCAA